MFTVTYCMKRHFLVLFLIVATVKISICQTTLKSDPAATAILNKLKAQYKAQKSSEIDFDLVIEMPGQKAETQKGKIVQSGKKFVATTNDQDLYCDGKTVWVYMKDAKEVQVNNFDPTVSSEFISPDQLLTMYDKGEYLYAITGQETIGSKVYDNIEFKPKDKKSQYSKIRMAIDKANQPHYIKVFSKNGSKFTLVINKIVNNRNYPSDYFVFNIKKHPGVHLEDLRID